MKLFLSLLLATSTSALVLPSQAALARQPINMPARSLARMSEEKPAAATSEQAQAEPGAAVDFTPKPVAEAPKEMGIDWSKYSITISLAVIFLVIKTLSYLGITNFSD